MAKATTIKAALKQWEDEREGETAVDAKIIELQFRIPPIEKMDATLGSLVNCEKLSLSTNLIEKIVGLNGLANLKILSLSRNNIKSLDGVEAVADSLEQLWVSYNIIDKLRGVDSLKKLRVFYAANNSIEDFGEINKLATLPVLRDLLFSGNPCVENMNPERYENECMRKLKALKVLDGVPLLRE